DPVAEPPVDSFGRLPPAYLRVDNLGGCRDLSNFSGRIRSTFQASQTRSQHVFGPRALRRFDSVGKYPVVNRVCRVAPNGNLGESLRCGALNRMLYLTEPVNPSNSAKALIQVRPSIPQPRKKVRIVRAFLARIMVKSSKSSLNFPCGSI